MLCAITLSSTAAVAVAADARPQPSKIGKAESPLKIDGVLDEPA